MKEERRNNVQRYQISCLVNHFVFCQKFISKIYVKAAVVVAVEVNAVVVVVVAVEEVAVQGSFLALFCLDSFKKSAEYRWLKIFLFSIILIR